MKINKLCYTNFHYFNEILQGIKLYYIIDYIGNQYVVRVTTMQKPHPRRRKNKSNLRWFQFTLLLYEMVELEAGP